MQAGHIRRDLHGAMNAGIADLSECAVRFNGEPDGVTGITCLCGGLGPDAQGSLAGLKRQSPSSLTGGARGRQPKCASTSCAGRCYLYAHSLPLGIA